MPNLLVHKLKIVILYYHKSVMNPIIIEKIFLEYFL